MIKYSKYTLLLLIFVSDFLSAQSFNKSIISNNLCGGAFGLIEYDINQDSYLDLIGTSKTDNSVMYFINDGSGNFTQNIVDNNLTGANFAFAGDLDGDLDLDFAAVGDNELVWYENDGNFNFTKHLITSVNQGEFLLIYDLDGDGDNDLAVAISGENYISAFLNDGSGNFNRFNVININNPKMFHGGDFDNDGNVDILAASFDDDTIAWYYFNGFYFTTGGTITNNFNGVWGIEGTDINGDGDWDVVATSYIDHTIAWFENDGSGNNFTQHNIDTGMIHALYTRTLDIDNDGDMDIVGTSNGNNGMNSQIALYINDGNQNFTKNILDNTSQGPAWLSVQDFNGDGAKDIAFAAEFDGEFILLTQQTASINNFQKNKLVIYPNPASNRIQIISDNKIEKAIIYDFTGRKVKICNSNIINVSGLSHGNYFLQVFYQNKITETKKLIIQ